MKDHYRGSVQETANRGKDVWTTAGTVLILLGVAVWAVYAVCRWGMGMNVTGRQFLPYHLAGVIPGVILKRRYFLIGLIKKMSGQQPS